ncbi:outer membrane protein assembly factor BamB family protein [Bremerella alba]|uniref:Outer membrane protein assembly factor BamB n=1 Tax=Bremerella alba TaxID=980252 RepID=A0A7V8V1S9_9BACT|nr:PQQ-binding-like beta-propeller repeat protein [Bremerella alba]MBA2113373.1 Outer membrane protein assembly factor BamB [Bremerella alba]
MFRPYAHRLHPTMASATLVFILSLTIFAVGCTPPPTGRPSTSNTTLNPNPNTTVSDSTVTTPAKLPEPDEVPVDETKMAVEASNVVPAKTSEELTPVVTPDEKPGKTLVDTVETTPSKTSDELTPPAVTDTPADAAMKEEAVKEEVTTEAKEEKPVPKEMTKQEEPAKQTPPEEAAAKKEEAKPVAEVASAKKTTTAASTTQSEADPQDWLFWRGPEFNGISRATGLPDSWDPEGGEGSNVLWKRDDLGTRSTPVVMNGKLFMLAAAEQGTPREGERVVCVDAKTGETIWENRFNVYLSDVPVERVGWSSVTADPTTNTVFALGVCGHFQCIDADTGKTIWTHKMHEEFGMLTTYGGRTNFPLVFEDLVIISGIVIGWGDYAKPAHRFLGIDKETGEVVWFTETTPLPYDTTYSTPTIKIVDGIPQYIIGAGDGKIWSIQPRTGQHNWSFSFAARGLFSTPLIEGDRVFMAQGEENVITTEEDGKVNVQVDNTMGAVVSVDATKRGDISVSGENWKIVELVANRSAPVIVDGKMYLIDDRAKMFILDPETGEELFDKVRLGSKMFGSPLYADGKFYLMTENGRYYVLGRQDDGNIEILSKGRLPDGDGIASPICAQGRLYFPTSAALYCVGTEDQKTGFSGLPEQPTEDPVSEDPKPAHAQLIPAETLIYPGKEVDYRVKLFNARGQFVKDAEKVDYSVEGPAKIDQTGKLTANEDAGHAPAYVTAKAGDLTGNSRLRIIPALPWSFDFENITVDEKTGKGEPPITWIGARYRHVVRDVDGNKVMVKITTIPKGTRSQGWMGHSDLHDYTIEADVMGHEKDGQLPDIGVTAQGYIFMLMGNESKARALTWITQQRIAKDVDFTLEPGVWYHIKFKVSNQDDGTAKAQGKAWKKDEPEPEAWMVEIVDAVPNTTGSPGLFGNAKTGEIYLDNIKVTPNS